MELRRETKEQFALMESAEFVPERPGERNWPHGHMGFGFAVLPASWAMAEGQHFWELARVATTRVLSLIRFGAAQAIGNQAKTAEPSALDSLKEKNERLRIFTQGTSEALAISEDGFIFDVNEQYLQLLGYEYNEVIGQPLSKFISPEARPEAEASIHGKSEAIYESVALTKAGKYLEVEIRPSHTYLGGKHIRISSIHDITKRKHHEQELRRLNRLYRMLSRIGNAVVHKQTRNELFNEICRAAVEAGGFTLCLITWLDQHASFQRAAWFGRQHDDADTSLALVAGISENAEELEKRIDDGQFVTNDLLAESCLKMWHPIARDRSLRSTGCFPLFLAGKMHGNLLIFGEERGIFKTSEVDLLRDLSLDISVALDRLQSEELRRQMEQDLRHSEYLLRQSQRVARVGSFLLDLHTGQWTSSEALDEIAGLDENFVRGPGSMQRLIHPEDWPSVQALSRALICREPGAESRSVEYRLKRPADGTEIWVQGRARLVTSNRDKPIRLQGIIQDITERKRAEEFRQKMELQLRQAQKMEAIGQLAAGIAHEINTPAQFIDHNLQFVQNFLPPIRTLLVAIERLRACRGTPAFAAELAEVEHFLEANDCQLLDKEIPDAVRESLEGVANIRKIVLAMKRFAHPGSDNFDKKEYADITQALESTINVSRSEWKYVSTIRTQFDPSLRLVPMFPGEFNQVILNLIINAAHAISQAQQTSHQQDGEIIVSTRLDGNWAEVRVRDNGTGIAPEYRHRIFELFFTTKSIGKGTGQGLALAHSIITEKHRGTITFETEVGVGTTFIVRLPMGAPPKLVC